MKQNDNDAVILRTYFNQTALDIARSCLQAEGIYSWVVSDDCAGMRPELRMGKGMQLCIHVADSERAEEIIARHELIQIKDSETSKVPGEKKPLCTRVRIYCLLWMIIGILCGMAGMYLWHDHTMRFTGLVESNYYPDDKPHKWVWYTNGIVCKAEFDNNYDEKTDVWIKYKYGKTVSIYHDNNFDEKVDVWYSYKNNETLSSQIDTDFNGIPDATCTYKYNIITRIDWRPNNATNIRRRELYENGVLKEEWLDTNDDGAFNKRIEYDAMENEVNQVTIY